MNRDSQENALYMETATGYLKKKTIYLQILWHRRNILNFGGITKEASQSVGIEFKYF